METIHPSSGQQDLLADLDEIVVLNHATQGQRFANYLIDLIVTYLIAFGLLFLYGVGISLNGGNAEDLPDQTLLYYLAVYSSLILYTSVMEAFNKGRTIGKLITGTYAVKNDGQPLDFGTALKRSFSRIVPFEPFSGFGAAPWHDKWTDTTVVKK